MQVGDEKNRNFRPVSHFGMTGGVRTVINNFRPSSMLITASVDFVYISRHSRRREQNSIYVTVQSVNVEYFKNSQYKCKRVNQFFEYEYKQLQNRHSPLSIKESLADQSGWR